MTTLRKVSAEERLRMIAEAAYFRAEKRGFDGGDCVNDWIAAESEVNAELRRSERQHVIERFEIGLATATKELVAFKKKITSVASEARREWQQDVDRLGTLRDALSGKLDEFRHQSEDAGEKARQQGEKLWGEITEIAERVGAKMRR